VAYIEEVEFISGAADAVGKEKNISFQPSNLNGRILKTYSWARHGSDILL
jgi:hypothetical protein